MYLQLFVGFLCWSLFRSSLFCILSRFTIILTRKRELVALLLLSFICLVTVKSLWMCLMVPWVCLPCVIVVFPDQTHLLSNTHNKLFTQKLLKQGNRYIINFANIFSKFYH